MHMYNPRIAKRIQKEGSKQLSQLQQIVSEVMADKKVGHKTAEQKRDRTVNRKTGGMATQHSPKVDALKRFKENNLKKNSGSDRIK